MAKIVKGIVAAMVTSMHDDESLNFQEIENQVNRQIAAGVDGVFCLGTNGEAYALSPQEKLRLEKLLADTSFRGRKEQLEEEIEDCLNQLDREPAASQDDGDALDENADRGRSRTSGPLIAVLFILAAIFLFINNLCLYNRYFYLNFSRNYFFFFFLKYCFFI